MIPPRFVPPGILQLWEISGDEKILLEELPMSSKNRDKINRIRNDILMVSPTKTLIVSENNAYRWVFNYGIRHIYLINTNAITKYCQHADYDFNYNCSA